MADELTIEQAMNRAGEDIFDPEDYFNYLKSRVNEVNSRDLSLFLDSCLTLAEKYMVTGQNKILSRIKFLTDCVEKEQQLIAMGITKYVYRDDIEEYIDSVSKNVVKIIELENYPRDIPDEIVEVIKATKGIFDQLYIVFTDYTGKIEKKVEKERRKKDPILFGTFQRLPKKFGVDAQINDRFYYLGDWTDNYCDLTLDKFLLQMGHDTAHQIKTPVNRAQILKQLEEIDKDFNTDEHDITEFVNTNPKNVSIGEKIRRFFKIERKR